MKHKRQHVVPNCYLSAWLEPVTPAGQQRALWKVAKDGTGKHRRSPKKTFVESDRYTVKLKNGERDLRVEHNLGQIEKDFSGVFRRLQRREQLSVRDRAKLAIFTAAMLGRAKRRADDWKGTWQDLRGTVFQFEGEGSGKQAWRSNPTHASLPPGAVRVSAEEIDEFLVNSHPEYLTNTIEISAPMLFAMDLSIYSTDDELGFLTSDEPCIMHNPTAHRYHPMMRSAGLLQRDVQVLLPLSPKLLIAFTHKRTYPFITPIAKELLDEFNRMMVWHADKEIVSWRGEVREEWFVVSKASLPDAWENRPQDDTEDIVKRQHVTIGTCERYPTEALARKAVQALLLNLNAEAPRAELEVPSFGTLLDKYAEEEMPDRYSTRKSYESNIKTHIRPKWADYPLDRIKPMPVEQWLRALKLAPKSCVFGKHA